jgi:hypothetical protein
LFDAALSALDAVQRGTGRRALLLLSDGDYRYTLTVHDVEGRVIESHTRVVQISTGGPQGAVPVIPVE